MSVTTGAKLPDAAGTARNNVFALNTGMFELYGEAGQLVQGSVLAQHPIITPGPGATSLADLH